MHAHVNACKPTNLENLVRPVKSGDGGGFYSGQDGQVGVKVVEAV